MAAALVSLVVIFPLCGVAVSADQDIPEALELDKQEQILVKARRYAEALPLSEKALALREAALGPEHPSLATNLNDLAVLYANTGQYVKAESLFQRTLGITEKGLGPEPPITATTLKNLADLYFYKTRQYAKAEPLYQRALAIREKALGQDHPLVDQSLHSMANLYTAMGAHEKAEPLLLRVLAMREKKLGSEHAGVGIALYDLAESYRAMGAYAKAEPLYQRALVVLEKAKGPDDLVVGVPLLGLANVYLATRNYEKAEPLLLRQLAIIEKANRPDHLNVVTSLQNLAVLYEQMGDYTKTESLYRKALAIRKQSLGDNHVQVAESLSDLWQLYYRMGSYPKAESLLQNTIAIQEKLVGAEANLAQSYQGYALLLRKMNRPEQAALMEERAKAILKSVSSKRDFNEAKTLDEKVAKLFREGKYSEALPLAQKALELREKALGPDHSSVAESLHSVGELYEELRSYEKAESFYQRANAIWEKTFGPNHATLATGEHDLAVMYEKMGQYGKAEPLFQRALETQEQALGPNHRDVARTLNNLAWLYHTKGDDSKALPIYQRALAIQEKVLGPYHLDVAISLQDLGDVYAAIRDFTKAEPLYVRALAIFEKALGPDNPRVAIVLQNLAHIYRAMGNYKNVESLYQRALAIREKAYGPNHPEVADTLDDLAGFYTIFWIADPKSAPRALNPKEDKIKRFAKAEPLYKRALAIREKVFGPEHLTVANSLSFLARGYFESGQETEAGALWERALLIYEKQGDSSSTGILHNLARTATRQHNYRAAIEFYKQLFVKEERQIQNAFAFTTEEQKLKFLEDLSGNYLDFLSLIAERFPNDTELTRYALEVVVRRKGIVFDAQSRMREAARDRMSDVLRQEWDRLSTLQRELSRLSLNKPAALTVEQYQGQLVKLKQQIEQIEQHLATGSGQIAQEIQQRDITIDGITRMLPKGGALIEFVNMTQGLNFLMASRYVAFVLRDSGQVSVIELGCRGVVIKEFGDEHALKCPKNYPVWLTIRSTIQTLKTSQHSGVVGSLRELYEDLWLPLEPVLETVDKIFISPDGDLNLVPFAALVDKAGRSLVERYRIAYVSSGRQLSGMIQPISRSQQSDLLLVANPAFDSHATGTSRATSALRSRDFNAKFGPLPGTEREAREIPPLIANKNGQEVLVGDQATENAVKSAHNPRILHLATHGFFLGEKEMASSQLTRGVSVSSQEGAGSSSRHENPLLRSGLAFAGANRASEVAEGDDGILTALEITGMDLSGTDLVVLSACDTGVGEEKDGEGVFGLRRAFALAGAKNLLLSLWPISDDITADQMKAFYMNLQRLPPAEALRQAQLETIKDLKAKYNGIAPPSLWAPFIIQGANALGS